MEAASLYERATAGSNDSGPAATATTAAAADGPMRHLHVDYYRGRLYP